MSACVSSHPTHSCALDGPGYPHSCSCSGLILHPKAIRVLGRDYPTGQIHGAREQALDGVTGKEEGAQMPLVGVPPKGTPDL